MKRIISILLSVIMITGLLNGCSSNNDDKDNSDGDAKNGKVYYLNFKPEVDDIWQEIAKEFTKDTGIECKVVTAASGKYEMTLESEIQKTDFPSLFQINGQLGFDRWRDNCLDLTDTDFAKYMNDTAKELAIKDEDKVYGIPYAIEGYGIIYNKKIMDKYFSLPEKSSEIKVSSADEIKDFATLKKVVEDMTKLKENLSIDGVFASTSLSQGEDWRWQTHLTNMPLYYEYKDKNITDSPKEIEFKYSENYKNIFDLYTNNSCTDKSKLSEKTVDGSMAEFALGKACMVQNGNWAWETISKTDGNIVSEEDVKYMPIYTGIDNETNQGLCVGTENYMCINKDSNADDIAATLEFLKWVFNSEKGKDYCINKLKFNVPFNTFNENEQPKDPLAKEIQRYSTNGTQPITWEFGTIPSEDFKTAFGGLLTRYTLDEISWDDVKKGFIETWATQASSNN